MDVTSTASAAAVATDAVVGTTADVGPIIIKRQSADLAAAVGGNVAAANEDDDSARVAKKPRPDIALVDPRTVRPLRVGTVRAIARAPLRPQDPDAPVSKPAAPAVPAAPAATAATDAIHESLKDSITCPVCADIMDGKIFQCQLGHVVCETCAPRLKECPSCRKLMPAVPIHALFAQQLRDRIAIPLRCRNAAYGCAFVAPDITAYRAHKDTCELAPARRCAFAGCAFTGDPTVVDAHMRICPNRRIGCALANCGAVLIASELEAHLAAVHPTTPCARCVPVAIGEDTVCALPATETTPLEGARWMRLLKTDRGDLLLLVAGLAAAGAEPSTFRASLTCVLSAGPLIATLAFGVAHARGTQRFVFDHRVCPWEGPLTTTWHLEVPRSLWRNAINWHSPETRFLRLAVRVRTFDGMIQDSTFEPWAHGSPLLFSDRHTAFRTLAANTDEMVALAHVYNQHLAAFEHRRLQAPASAGATSEVSIHESTAAPLFTFAHVKVPGIDAPQKAAPQPPPPRGSAAAAAAAAAPPPPVSFVPPSVPLGPRPTILRVLPPVAIAATAAAAAAAAVGSSDASPSQRPQKKQQQQLLRMSPPPRQAGALKSEEKAPPDAAQEPPAGWVLGMAPGFRPYNWPRPFEERTGYVPHPAHRTYPWVNAMDLINSFGVNAPVLLVRPSASTPTPAVSAPSCAREIVQWFTKFSVSFGPRAEGADHVTRTIFLARSRARETFIVVHLVNPITGAQLAVGAMYDFMQQRHLCSIPRSCVRAVPPLWDRTFFVAFTGDVSHPANDRSGPLYGEICYAIDAVFRPHDPAWDTRSRFKSQDLTTTARFFLPHETQWGNDPAVVQYPHIAKTFPAPMRHPDYALYDPSHPFYASAVTPPPLRAIDTTAAAPSAQDAANANNASAVAAVAPGQMLPRAVSIPPRPPSAPPRAAAPSAPAAPAAPVAEAPPRA